MQWRSQFNVAPAVLFIVFFEFMYYFLNVKGPLLVIIGSTIIALSLSGYCILCEFFLCTYIKAK